MKIIAYLLIDSHGAIVPDDHVLPTIEVRTELPANDDPGQAPGR